VNNLSAQLDIIFSARQQLYRDWCSRYFHCFLSGVCVCKSAVCVCVCGCDQMLTSKLWSCSVSSATTNCGGKLEEVSLLCF